MQKTNYPLEQLNSEWLFYHQLFLIDEMNDSIVQLLYQSGYMTIKDYDDCFKAYQLGFPNREIEEGFKKQYQRFFAAN